MIVLKLFFLFLLFSIIGWIIEVTFRSIVSRHFVNPGFMTGITLPIYGGGGLVLTLIGKVVDSITSNYKYILFFLLATLIMTMIEYIDGYIFLKYYNIKLWDYSKNKFNYQGLICLSFSIAWGILGVFFYTILYGHLDVIVNIFLSNIYYVFVFGLLGGIFLVDLFFSFNLLKLIKNYSYLVNETINIEELKNKLLHKSKKIFFLPNLELRRKLIKLLLINNDNV